MRRILIFIGSAVALASPRPADACSRSSCFGGYFTPASGSTVPANTPALFWRPLHGLTTYNPTLVTLTTSSNISLAFTLTLVGPLGYVTQYDHVIVPEQPLVEGTTYTLTDSNVCSSDMIEGPSVTFQAGPAAPMPTELGTLSLTFAGIAPLVVTTSSGSCTAEVEAARTVVTLTLAADALPWRDALHFETLVDGRPWTELNLLTTPPGSSSQGRGRDLLFRICHTDDPGVVPGLDGNPHEVSMRATLPGSDVALTTPALSFQLECPAEPDPVEPVTADGGCSTTTGTSPWLVLLIGLGLRRRGSRAMCG
jgi:hypothetical protein